MTIDPVRFLILFVATGLFGAVFGYMVGVAEGRQQERNRQVKDN